jgi:hypothetical protein
MGNTLSKCRSGCPTQDHESWGECARVSNIGITNETVANVIKTTDKELSAYRDARKLGIQPASTKMKDIQKAVRVSDSIGRAAKA